MVNQKTMSVKVTILGCGTSTGVPLIHCKCSVCRSKNPKNQRLRASAWIQTQGASLLIDTSIDFRQQALRAKIPKIDAVLLTHPHADHIGGIDEIRAFNYVQKQSMPVYGNTWTHKDLVTRFPYIFDSGPVEGGGIPQLQFHEIDEQAFPVKGVQVQPIRVKHGSKDCLGFRVGSFAYITDCSEIPETSTQYLEGLSVFVLDCVRLQRHRTHFNLDQALEAIFRLKPRKTYLTHLGHDFEYSKWSKKLPRGVALAYDGLKISID